MNPLAAELFIEKVISKRRPMAAERYILGIFNGELKCIGKATMEIAEVEIIRLTEYQIERGFTSSQWDSMAKLIVDYCERKTKCLDDLIR